MKKKIYVLSMLILGVNLSYAEPIDPGTAKSTATGFLKQSGKPEQGTLSLMYTGTLPNGNAAYYVFNMSANNGFIIIAADNAAHPVIGYSTDNQFSAPAKNSNFGSWLQKRVREIEYIQTNKVKASAEVSAEWAEISTPDTKRTSALSSVATVTALVHTTWDQSPYYNDMCPSASVTGCVATAMAQIMRYWSYPATGMGSSSYCDCMSSGSTNNYGTLTANYGLTSYNWSNMPLSIHAANNDIATLMYQCGVSVEMDYDPSGSGAWVIKADDPVCAQTSYVNYFGYDPTTIKGLKRAYYSDNSWLQVLKNDLNLGRPIQYVGDDASEGGHTWVCDGYDQNNKFHMNWGWGGYGNGYFTVDNLNVGGFNPIEDEEALIGIKPPTNGADIGISSILSPNGTSCSSSANPLVTLQNFGTVTLSSCTINYQLDNGTSQTQAWSGSLATFQSVNVPVATIGLSAGIHTLVCSTSNPNNGADVLASNNQSTVIFNIAVTGNVLPVMEGFEGSAGLPLAWSVDNPDNDVTWEVTTDVSRSGTKCIGINNCNGIGDYTDLTGRRDRLYTKSYDFSSPIAQMMNFDVASAPYYDGNNMLQDTLALYYSKDCGSTWNLLYKKSATLATAPPFSTSYAQYCWQPTGPAEWRTDTINLAVLAGSPSVIFAFENISSWSEWLFLDNINISTNSVGIKSYTENDGVTIYPNPAKEAVTIEGTGNTGNVNFMIYNVSGMEIKSGAVKTTGNGFKDSVNITELSGGLYFIKLSDEKKVWIKKFSVQ